MNSGTNASTPGAQALGHAKEVIRVAQEELNELLRQRATIMKRIGTAKQALLSLVKVFGDDELPAEVLQLLGRGSTRKQPGFTRACRVILMEAGTALEARQGLWELRRRFPHLIEHHKAPVASVTTVFNRLVGQSEARSFTNGRGRRVWEWIAEPTHGSEAGILSPVDDGLAAEPIPGSRQ